MISGVIEFYSEVSSSVRIADFATGEPIQRHVNLFTDVKRCEIGIIDAELARPCITSCDSHRVIHVV